MRQQTWPVELTVEFIRSRKPRVDVIPDDKDEDGFYRLYEGAKIGRWTLVEEVWKAMSNGRKKFWFCRCGCGVERDVQATNLRSGLSKSCGCLSMKISRKQRGAQ